MCIECGCEMVGSETGIKDIKISDVSNQGDAK
jgi:hypothetical protein